MVNGAREAGVTGLEWLESVVCPQNIDGAVCAH